jgi:hypothetical protein
MDRNESRAVVAGMLMNKVRQERYPSATELSLIEQIIPPQLLPRYVDVLVEKIAQDDRPSISLLHRLDRVTREMP